MKTYDGLDLSVATNGPWDAPSTMFLADCWTLNQAGLPTRSATCNGPFGDGIHIATWDHRGHGESPRSKRDAATIEASRATGPT